MLKTTAEPSPDRVAELDDLTMKITPIARLVEHASDVLAAPPIFPTSARGAVLLEFHDGVDAILSGASAMLRELHVQLVELSRRMTSDRKADPEDAG